MSDEPNDYVKALAQEHAWHPERALAISEELMKHGWTLDDDGNPQKVKQRRSKESPPENTAAEKAPEDTSAPRSRRTRQKPSES